MILWAISTTLLLAADVGGVNVESAVPAGGVGAAAIGAIIYLLNRHDKAIEKRDATMVALIDKYEMTLEKKDAQILATGERYERAMGELKKTVEGVTMAIEEFRRDAAARDSRHMDLSGRMVTAVEHVTTKLNVVEQGISKLEIGQQKMVTEITVLGGRVGDVEKEVGKHMKRKPLPPVE